MDDSEVVFNFDKVDFNMANPDDLVTNAHRVNIASTGGPGAQSSPVVLQGARADAGDCAPFSSLAAEEVQMHNCF